MKFNDAITGALFLALAIFIGAYGYSLPPMPGQPYGAGAFPIAVALGLGSFSLLLMVQALRARAATMRWVELAPWARSRDQLINFIATLALILIYVLLADRTGFILMSIAILLILFVRQGVPLLRASIVAVATTIVIQIAFADLLRVPLPLGPLTGIIW